MKMDCMGSIVGEYDNPGFEEGPTQSRLIHSPVGIACRESSVILLSISLIVKGAYDCFNI